MTARDAMLQRTLRFASRMLILTFIRADRGSRQFLRQTPRAIA